MNNSNNKELKDYARDLRTQSVSRAEKFIWKTLLSRKQAGVAFKRQRIIDRFIVDFFSQEVGLIIEIDGNSHRVKNEYDAYRQKSLEKKGFVFLRFKESDVLNNLDDVANKILYAVDCLKSN